MTMFIEKKNLFSSAIDLFVIVDAWLLLPTIMSFTNDILEHDDVDVDYTITLCRPDTTSFSLYAFHNQNYDVYKPISISKL